MFSVSFNSEVNNDYTLYRGPLNAISSPVATAPGVGGLMQLADTNPPTATQMYYRVEQVSVPAGGLVINEVDYDQASTDASSFIEIYNSSANEIALANYAVVLVNGNGNLEYARYNLSVAGTSLAPGGYLVIRNAAVTVPGGALFLDVPGDFIQNGAPDGVAIVDTTSNTVVDALSYEGSITAAQITGFSSTVSLVEAVAFTTADLNADSASLIRSPNGTDTNSAIDDWAFTTTVTPGAANTLTP